MDITELLAFSAKQGASDLHLSAGLPPMIRVDGDIRRINLPPLEHKQVHDLIYDIMNDKQRKDFEEFLETDFSFEVPGVARFRVNAFNQNRGAGGVFRTIPSKVLTMEDLGMGQVFRDISLMPRGLVLVTGPTGSGKSTTLAAMIDFINDNRTSTSSRSRIRSNSCTTAASAWSTSARCTGIRSVLPRRCAAPCARTRTSSWSARCVTSRPSAWR
jgi:twitching motility protein PilT